MQYSNKKYIILDILVSYFIEVFVILCASKVSYGQLFWSNIANVNVYKLKSNKQECKHLSKCPKSLLEIIISN